MSTLQIESSAVVKVPHGSSCYCLNTVSASHCQVIKLNLREPQKPAAFYLSICQCCWGWSWPGVGDPQLWSRMQLFSPSAVAPCTVLMNWTDQFSYDDYVSVNFLNHHRIRPSCEIPEARENMCVCVCVCVCVHCLGAHTHSEIRACSREAAGQWLCWTTVKTVKTQFLWSQLLSDQSRSCSWFAPSWSFCFLLNSDLVSL